MRILLYVPSDVFEMPYQVWGYWYTLISRYPSGTFLCITWVDELTLPWTTHVQKSWLHIHAGLDAPKGRNVTSDFHTPRQEMRSYKCSTDARPCNSTNWRWRSQHRSSQLAGRWLLFFPSPSMRQRMVLPWCQCSSGSPMLAQLAW